MAPRAQDPAASTPRSPGTPPVRRSPTPTRPMPRIGDRSSEEPRGARAERPGAPRGTASPRPGRPSQDQARSSVQGLDDLETLPGGAGGPGGTDRPGGPALPRGPRGPRRRSRVPRPLRLGATLLALVLVLMLGWGLGLTVWANSRIQHVDALSGAEGTSGTTYLIAGSDKRDGEAVSDDGTEGSRADTMMLLHKAPGGNSYLISLPRDTLVDIPGKGRYKLNAAYAFGGAPLLVETVEEFSGLTIDHYVEVGFDGVSNVVDAVGHVNLCIDQDVDDEKSGLTMTEGCHDVEGEQALAFVRARYFDPTADLGRQERQQQFVGALMSRVTSPSVMLNPLTQVKLAGAGSESLTTDESTGIVDVARMALTARSAMNSGSTPVLPIEDPEYQTQHSGVAILTDDEDIAAFFDAVGDGSAEVPET